MYIIAKVFENIENGTPKKLYFDRSVPNGTVCWYVSKEHAMTFATKSEAEHIAYIVGGEVEER